MFTDKQKVLYDAPFALNRPDQPWYVSVEGDAIVARWKWMDAMFFAPQEVDNETRNYTFTVTLDNNGKWKEIDVMERKSASAGSQGGKVGFGTSYSSFKGHASQKSFSFGVGQNNQTGQVGFIGFKFDTAVVKNAVRGYLTQCGWKKAGLFG